MPSRLYFLNFFPFFLQPSHNLLEQFEKAVKADIEKARFSHIKSLKKEVVSDDDDD